MMNLLDLNLEADFSKTKKTVTLKHKDNGLIWARAKIQRDRLGNWYAVVKQKYGGNLEIAL